MKLLLILSGIFYAVLCVFSIVTGLIYMSGKRKLNPLELSDKYVEKICNESEYILLSSTDDYFAVYKMNKFDEYIFGCYGLYVEYKDGKINIDFSVYDVVEDFEEKIEEGFFE